ncbi:MAG: discoidin domain-containing protein [Clostridia bacterium]|nr:discoidin domain-containing protein [Clostridia bacterium]
MKKIIAILLSVLMVVSMVVVFAVPASAETIVVDGDLADDGWAADGWTTVTPDNGYWQTVPKTSDTLSYKYQLRSDDTKLYGAVIADCALVVGGNGAGTNVRLWIRTNDEATVYTHFYDINAAALDAKYNTKTDANSAAKIDGTSLNGVAVENEGKSYFEFSVDLSEFGGKTSFDYFMSVSNKVNENVCLFYPVVTEGADRKDNLPYNTWDAANDITVNTADIALKADVADEESSDSDVSVESANVALGKNYTGADAANATYTANLTDGEASDEEKYESIWFGLYYNSKATTPSVNAPDGVANIVIDLEDVYNLDEVKLHFWNANTSGIGAPASIAVSVSEDGDTYSDAIAVDPAVGDAPAWTAKELGEVSGRYVKFTITMAEGATWCFLNEIEVYGDVEVAAGDVSDVPSTPGKPNTPVKPGDASNSVVFVLIALIAMAGSAVVIKNRK